MRFLSIDTPIRDLKIIERKPFKDHRGSFTRLYCANEFQLMGISKPISQINQTITHKLGAVRGMHYQKPPYAEIKLVSCLKGEIFDIAVDLRNNSPTFLHWYGVILSEDNQKSLLIPEGFAHGFQALTNNCELIYFHTAMYQKESEGALNIIDPKININWPLRVSDISEKDRSHPMITEEFKGITL
jgi:dTDP-4-dehydrorhamnose 3,5-epimerase